MHLNTAAFVQPWCLTVFHVTVAQVILTAWQIPVQQLHLMIHDMYVWHQFIKARFPNKAPQSTHSLVVGYSHVKSPPGHNRYGMLRFETTTDEVRAAE